MDNNNGYGNNTNNPNNPDNTYNDGYGNDTYNSYNNGYGSNQYNGYNNGYENNQYNGYNNGYGNPNPYGQQPNMNNYNPIPAPNQYRNCKTRNTIAVFLSGLLGILLFFNCIVIGLRFGLFSENGLNVILEDSGTIDSAIDEILDEINDEIDIADFESEERDNIKESMNNVITYFTDVIETGKLPDREDVKEDVKNLYNALCEVCINSIIAEYETSGDSVTIDELIGDGETDGLISAIGKEKYDNYVSELKNKYGETIVINNSIKEALKEDLMTLVKENETTINEAVDTIYEGLEELQSNTDLDGVSLSDIFNLISNAVWNAIIIISILAVICLVGIILVDKQISVTLRGLYSPFFVPGLIVTIISILLKLLVGAFKNSLVGEEEVVINLVQSFGDVLINPILICGIVFMVLAIVFRIIGKIIAPKNDDSF
ncbi:MAG: hypothetical protein IIX45_05080 [Lachnospiraceae bacterium]|nr:hypothetical protein [Lachnospiraceae bacterium]